MRRGWLMCRTQVFWSMRNSSAITLILLWKSLRKMILCTRPSIKRRRKRSVLFAVVVRSFYGPSIFIALVPVAVLLSWISAITEITHFNTSGANSATRSWKRRFNARMESSSSEIWSSTRIRLDTRKSGWNAVSVIESSTRSVCYLIRRWGSETKTTCSSAPFACRSIQRIN